MITEEMVNKYLTPSERVELAEIQSASRAQAGVKQVAGEAVDYALKAMMRRVSSLGTEQFELSSIEIELGMLGSALGGELEGRAKAHFKKIHADDQNGV